MRLLLAAAVLSAALPSAAWPLPRRETLAPTSSQCIGHSNAATYVAPYGSVSTDQCTALIQHCTNSIKTSGSYNKVPQPVSPPYFVCE